MTTTHEQKLTRAARYLERIVRAQLAGALVTEEHIRASARRRAELLAATNGLDGFLLRYVSEDEP